MKNKTGTTQKDLSNISFSYLRRFNLFMGTLHLIQAILMLTFSITIDKISAFRTPIWSYFLKFDQEKMRLVTEPRKLGEIPFGIFVSFFLFISAIPNYAVS